MGKYRLIIPVLIIALALASCASRLGDFTPVDEGLAAGSAIENYTSPSGSVIIVLRHDGTEDSLTHKGALRFKGHLEALSDEKIKVEVYPANRLGNREDTEYALRYGTVTMYIGEPLYGVLPCVAWTPLSGGMELYEGKVLQGKIRDMIDDECAENGVLYLGTISDEYLLVSSSRPLEAVGDFSRLRVASPRAESGMAFWDALGSSLVESPADQIYTAIQQGIVDAQEDTAQGNLVMQIARHHSYVTLLNHRIFSRAAYINRKFYGNLSADQQRMIDESILEARRYMEIYIESSYTNIMWRLEDAGVSVGEAPQSLREEIRQLTRDPLIGDLKARYGDELVDAVIEGLES